MAKNTPIETLGAVLGDALLDPATEQEAKRVLGSLLEGLQVAAPWTPSHQLTHSRAMGSRRDLYGKVLAEVHWVDLVGYQWLLRMGAGAQGRTLTLRRAYEQVEAQLRDLGFVVLAPVRKQIFDEVVWDPEPHGDKPRVWRVYSDLDIRMPLHASYSYPIGSYWCSAPQDNASCVWIAFEDETHERVVGQGRADTPQEARDRVLEALWAAGWTGKPDGERAQY